MKTLFNTAAVAHIWAQQRQHEGSNPGNTLFFRDELIWSYGRHFCIARRLGPGGTVVMMNRKSTLTTRSHMAYVRQSLTLLTPIVYCHDPSESARDNMAAARHEIAAVLERSENLRIRKTPKFGLLAEALALAEQANDYLAALPEDERTGQAPIDTLNQAEALAHALEVLVEWRAGETKRGYALAYVPIALRLNTVEGKQCIETSRGASISLAAAKRVWGYVRQARSTHDDYACAIVVGPYTMDKVCSDGSIVVGCHNIAYSEIEAMARELGWLQEFAEVTS